MIKQILSIFTLIFISMLSYAANAGTWGASVVDHTVQVTSTQNLATVAGTSNTSPTSGTCAAPAAWYYYEVSSWQCRLGVCRGVLTVYRQSCI